MSRPLGFKLPRDYKRKCVICGKYFMSCTDTAKYDSPICRMIASSERKKKELGVTREV